MIENTFIEMNENTLDIISRNFRFFDSDGYSRRAVSLRLTIRSKIQDVLICELSYKFGAAKNSKI